MSTKFRTLLLLPLLALVNAISLPTLAIAQTTWQLRVGGVWSDPDGGSEQRLIGGGRATTDIESDLGLTATAEVLINDRIGIEFGALMIGSPELLVRGDLGGESFEIRDSFDIHLLGAGVNFHLTPNRALDVYFGPFIGHAIFDDLAFVVGDDDVRFKIGEELAYGATLGVDVPLGEQWSFNAAARYVALEIEPDGADGVADRIDLDTLALNLGFGLRF